MFHRCHDLLLWFLLFALKDMKLWLLSWSAMLLFTAISVAANVNIERIHEISKSEHLDAGVRISALVQVCSFCFHPPFVFLCCWGLLSKKTRKRRLDVAIFAVLLYHYHLLWFLLSQEKRISLCLCFLQWALVF